MANMTKAFLPLCLVAATLLTWACGGSGSSDLTPGSEVTIEMPDGSLVTGRVADTKPADESEPATGADPAAPEPPADAPPATPKPTAGAVTEAPKPTTDASPLDTARQALTPPEPSSHEPEFAEVTVPAGTTLALTLDGQLASDLSRVEDAVRARVERPVTIHGVVAIPTGSMVHGTVTTAEAAGKVRGRARLAFRFDELDIDNERHAIRSDTVSYEAEGTKADDAKKVGIGAGAGALIGGLLGGKKGAGAGALIGGGAGTTMVLTTAGDEVELRSGTPVEVSLAQPLILVVPKD